MNYKGKWLLIASAVVASSFAWTTAGAQTTDNERCKNQQYLTAEIAAIRKTVVGLNDAVELVPPEDEAEYIRDEARKAMAQRNKVRFNAVARRHYYPAQEFHNDATRALDNLESAKIYVSSGKDLARFLVTLLSRLGELGSSMRSFMDADQSRQPSTLTDEARSSIYYFLPSAVHQTEALLQCVIKAL